MPTPFERAKALIDYELRLDYKIGRGVRSPLSSVEGNLLGNLVAFVRPHLSEKDIRELDRYVAEQEAIS